MSSHTQPEISATPHDIRLYTLLAAVPAGKVVTYGQLAELAGFPRRARWVGQMLKGLPDDTRLPWHRVINARGQISLPVPGPGELQQQRLNDEGVVVSPMGRIDLRQFQWHP